MYPRAVADLPILEHPGAGPAVVDPAAASRKHGKLPARAVLCFFADEIERARAAARLRPRAHLGSEGVRVPLYVLGRGARATAVCFPGVGASQAAATLEVLIACGVRRVIVCGGAGCLIPLPAETIVIPTRALRAEGTSYHYQRRGRWSRPSSRAVAAMEASCRTLGIAARRVRTWTTDGVFRETERAIRHRRAEGCSVVEMEAAALFAVARFRGIDLGQILYAGDDVSGETWLPRQWSTLPVRSLLLRLALDAVHRMA